MTRVWQIAKSAGVPSDLVINVLRDTFNVRSLKSAGSRVNLPPIFVESLVQVIHDSVIRKNVEGR